MLKFHLKPTRTTHTENDEQRKICFMLIFSAYLLYLFSISTKMCYTAQLVEIIDYFGSTKSAASVCLTVYYIIYAVAQVVLGLILPKLNLKKFLAVTIIGSAVSFSCISFAGSLSAIGIILGLNGIFHCGIWGGLMHYFGMYLPNKFSSFAVKLMSTGFALGTAISYGISALFSSILSWQWTFVFFAVFYLFALVFFLFSLGRAERSLPQIERYDPHAKADETPAVEPAERKAILLMLAVAVGICFCTTCGYYAISNWFPSLLKEVHGMPSSYSMLLTILLPVSMMPGPLVAQNTCEKYHGHTLAVSTVCVGIQVFAIGGLYLFYDRGILPAILLTVLFLFACRADNNLLCSYLPMKMRRYIETGFSSLIINAVACIGAAVAPFISAKIMDAFGWGTFYLLIFFFLIFTLGLFIAATIAFHKHNDL